MNFLFPTPQEFHAWLASREDLEFHVTATSCPLAVFLDEHIGKHVSVCSHQYQVGNSGWLDLPHWAMMFIHEFDNNTFQTAKDAAIVMRNWI